MNDNSIPVLFGEQIQGGFDTLMQIGQYEANIVGARKNPQIQHDLLDPPRTFLTTGD